MISPYCCHVEASVSRHKDIGMRTGRTVVIDSVTRFRVDIHTFMRVIRPTDIIYLTHYVFCRVDKQYKEIFQY